MIRPLIVFVFLVLFDGSGCYGFQSSSLFHPSLVVKHGSSSSRIVQQQQQNRHHYYQQQQQQQQQQLLRPTLQLGNQSNNKNGGGMRRRRTNTNVALFSTNVDVVQVNGDDAASMMVSSSSVSSSVSPSSLKVPMKKMTAMITKIAMIAYIASLCIALPCVLLPQKLIPGIPKTTKERWATTSSQFVCRWLLRFIPFCRIHCVGTASASAVNPEPTVWVCNHTSMLDVFLLLASDHKLRGKHRRPIKIVYWKQLEDNPVTKLLFRQAGFIPVDMKANKAGEDNVYDRGSFKSMLKSSKRAFQEGFDLGILPEGQLNPHPEQGLLPIFSGAYTLAKMSRRPIQMVALHGAHNLWHPDETIGMTVTSRDVWIRAYEYGRSYSSSDDFIETFTNIVGHFGQYGTDRNDVEQWLNGSAYQQKLQKQQQQQQEEKKKEKARKAAEAEAQAAALEAEAAATLEAATAEAEAVAADEEAEQRLGKFQEDEKKELLLLNNNNNSTTYEEMK